VQAPRSDRSDLARLQRWVDAGGSWRLGGRSGSAVTVLLLRCDGGEELERFTSSDPELLRHVADAGPDALR
jgi:hypothetical protein